jgi:hypothetical protein
MGSASVTGVRNAKGQDDAALPPFSTKSAHLVTDQAIFFVGRSMDVKAPERRSDVELRASPVAALCVIL